tara:strand:- start:336 stop:494 length:159 start_codon:yes stop_codon:yes gene_type:complete
MESLNEVIGMSGCRRQCDWDEKMVCRSCGIDYGVPEPSKKESVETPPADEEE